MSQWGRYILFFGILSGFIVGGIMIYIALRHNPQNEFTDNPEKALPLFFIWAAAVSFPFTLIAATLEVIRVLRKRG